MRIFIFIIILVSQVSWATSSRECALVLRSKGLVSVSYNKTNKRELIRRGYLFTGGATLQTGSNGFVLLKCINSGSTILLRPRSELVLNAIKNNETKELTENVEIKAGEAYIKVKQTKDQTFELYTPSNLASLQECECLVVLSTTNHQTTLYTLSGTGKIADNNFTTWWDLTPQTAAFSVSNGFVNVSSLSSRTLPRLFAIRDSSLNFRTGPILTHTLTIKSGSDGVVEPRGKLVVLHNVGIDIKAIADVDYQFTRWNIIDGNTYVPDVSAPETQIFVSSDALIEAQFSDKPSQLNITPSPYGTTNPKEVVSLQKGLPLTITINPKKGYSFRGWKKSGNLKIKKINPVKTAVTLFGQSATITPRFRKKSYTLSIKKSSNGTTKPTKALTVEHGDSLSLSATPKEGYRFIEWKIREGHATLREPRNPNAIVVCDSMDVSVEALFDKNTVEISILPHEHATISPQGNFYVSRDAFLSVSVIPDTGYMVSGWHVERGKAHIQGYEYVIIKCKNPFEIVPDITVKKNYLTLTTNEFGTVTPAKPQLIEYNTPTRIIATPSEGKYFINWNLSSGWAAIANPQRDTTEIVMTHSDAVIEAMFAPTICTLTVLTTLGGYTEPAGTIKSFEGGSIIVNAVPNQKAAFLGWKVFSEKDSTQSGESSAPLIVTDTFIGTKQIQFSDTLDIPEQTITSLKGNATIQAIFSTETVKLSVLTNGLGQTDPTDESYVVKNKLTTVKATANENQAFLQWVVVSGEHVEFEDPFNAITTVNPGVESCVIKALFQPDSLAYQESTIQSGEYSLKIICDNTQGLIDTEDKIIMKPGEPIVITAKPKSGFYLQEWREIDGDVDFSDNKKETTKVTLKSDAIIMPDFEPKAIQTLEIIFQDSEKKKKTIQTRFR